MQHYAHIFGHISVMKKITSFFLFALCILGAFSVQAQRMVADKIIAQIGDRIILKSDIDNAIADYKRQEQEAMLPPNPECAFLQGQLIQKTLVIQAERDSIAVDESEIDALLDNQVRYFIRMYGSPEMLEEIAGKTIYQIKEDLRQPFKERKQAEQMQAKILENIKITPNEVKEYYEKIPKDSLRFYESEVEVAELVLYPKANKDLDDFVGAQLLEWKRQVETGAKKFDALAKLYSDDPGSKESGGQYSINRNDKNTWDPAFMNACFKLKEGQISSVVKSEFGLHIIQMVSRAGDEAVVRHILKIPPVTDVEVKQSLARLDSLRKEITKGNISFSNAVFKYSDDKNSKFTAGFILGPSGSTYITIDQLDKDAAVALKDLKPGDVSKTLSYTDERQRKAVRILFLKTRTEPHRENLKDDYNKVSQRALEIKKENALEKWFRDHIPNYYIRIDKDYENCTGISEYIKASNTAAR